MANPGTYLNLKKENEEKRGKHADPSKQRTHYLGTDGYPDVKVLRNPMCCFQAAPINFHEQEVPYLKQHTRKVNKNNKKKDEDGRDTEDLLAKVGSKVAKDLKMDNNHRTNKDDPKKIYFMRTRTARETGVDEDGNP